MDAGFDALCRAAHRGQSASKTGRADEMCIRDSLYPGSGKRAGAFFPSLPWIFLRSEKLIGSMKINTGRRASARLASAPESAPDLL